MQLILIWDCGELSISFTYQILAPSDGFELLSSVYNYYNYFFHMVDDLRFFNDRFI
jgi:hypothetical protein